MWRALEGGVGRSIEVSARSLEGQCEEVIRGRCEEVIRGG